MAVNVVKWFLITQKNGNAKEKHERSAFSHKER